MTEEYKPEFPEYDETDDRVFPEAGTSDEIAAGDSSGSSVIRRRQRFVSRGDVLCYGLLALVLLVAAWLRFDAQNWDDYTHLHPDERFLTEVVTRIDGPLQFSDTTIEAQTQHRIRCENLNMSGDDYGALLGGGRGGYFDADCSPLNPNNIGKGLYVYGEFPLFTVRAAAVARNRLSEEWHTLLTTFDPDAAASHTVRTHWTTYTGAQFIGRSVAALSDVMTVLVLFLLGRRLYGRWTGLLAAGLYGVAAFPIQQSHFWTVDCFTTLWVTLALYLAVRALDGAGAVQGPSALAYLAVWAVGTGWEAGYQSYPSLGLVSLGAIFLVTLAVTSGISLWRRVHGWRGADLLAASSAVITSVIYLVAWAVGDSVALRDFPLSDPLFRLGLASLVFGLASLVTFVAAGVVRRPPLGLETDRRHTLAVASVGVVWLALVITQLVDGLAPWSALFVALAAVALMIFDVMDITDYALFGVVLGGAVASRINVAPLAGIIVLAALIRLLPVLDRSLSGAYRSRIVMTVVAGVAAAAILSFIVFRLLQPHAFMGPGLFGLRLNPVWRENMSQSAYLTSGDWDAPPNHQWASRTPYLFPWRNIVLWGMGIPLGLVAWGAWAWAGTVIVRARPRWTRHVIPFVWVLVYFGWIGGRWVTTMRYFLPIYPALILFGAWALVSLLVFTWRRWRERPAFTQRPAVAGRAARWARLAFALVVGLCVLVVGYTLVYGFAFHTVERTQLTRVAASRWFFENVPGDFGVWIEGDDGSRELVNLGQNWVATPPAVTHIEDGDTQELTFTVPADGRLESVTLQHVGDPARDADEESVRVRIFADDPALGRQLLFEDTLTADLNQGASVYGALVQLVPDEPVTLPKESDSSLGVTASYVLQVTALDGPVMLVHDVSGGGVVVMDDITLALSSLDGQVAQSVSLAFEGEPLLIGYGDDIPITPTHWTVGSADSIPFFVPIDGEIREIEIPHLGDPLKDADIETVRFTLIGSNGQESIATVSDDFNTGANPLGPARTVTFDPPLRVQARDSMGNRQVVTLLIEALDPVYTSGPVVAWEGDWDDPVPWPTCPLPDDMVYQDDLPSGLSAWNCLSWSMYGSHYQGIKLWMALEDTQQKYEAMTNALDQADYLVITSNRFYDSLSRISMRWPMSMAFYDALFEGRLGFDLVRTFESYPRLGPITFKDQILPTDDLPDWLNEYWEAEEAFHVYDHPVVFVFRKTPDYTSEQMRAVLDSVSLRQASVAVSDFSIDSDPIGVVTWGAKLASQSPTMLELTDEQREIQRDGGTWSDLFPRGWLVNRNEIAALVIWWLLTVLVGWVAWPLLAVALPALPDRGFPAAKLAGWLIVAWVAWVGGTLHLLTWTRPGLLVILIGLALFSGVVVWLRRDDLRAYLRSNWRHMLAMEGLTLLLFLFFVGVRAGNPDLWHANWGGEKPMDFAYFNAVLRSTIFPPLDPWFAGGYINYYYFGYVIVGAPVKLLGLDPAVAYNLILPTLYAMTGVGMFSLAYNWVKGRADRRAWHAVEPVVDADGESLPAAEPVVSERPAPAGKPWLAGIAALLLAVVLGNLGTALLVTREIAKLDGWQPQPMLSSVRRAELEANRQQIYDDFYAEEVADFRDEIGREPQDPTETGGLALEAHQRTEEYITERAKHPPLVRLWSYNFDGLRAQITAFFGGLDNFMRGEPLQMHTHRWYWAPTRIISELEPQGVGQNAIAEMPYFTFLYGDLHAHMLAMPIMLLALLWLLAEMLGAGYGQRARWESGLALGLGGLAVGVLRPTNSWDWYTYMILAMAGLTYVAWLNAVRTTGDRPPSAAAARMWAWLRPRQAAGLWPVLLVVPLGALARVALYVVRRMQADEQASRLLRVGETPIEASLTLSSLIVWSVAALALAVLLYVAVLIALRAYFDRRTLLNWIGRVGVFAALSILVGLPFTAYFATPFTSVEPWKLERTPLWAYLYIHGLFIFLVISLLVWQTARWLRRVRVRALRGMIVPVGVIGGGCVLTLLAALVIGVREVPIAQLVLPLVAWSVVLFLLPDQNARLRALYALIVLALCITFGVEVVVVKGDIGRQNTVFKFYMQAWLLFSLVGGVGLAWMLHSSARWSVALRGLWHGALAILCVIALMYPILATQARWLDRFNREDTPLTLDGMAYMQYAVHGEFGLWFRMEGDYNMIRWLQDHVEGTPVIMEAHVYPSEYHWGGRISIYTGLPTILGWRFHQTQQRGLLFMDRLIRARENNIAAFYTLEGSGGIRTAMNLIDAYDIEYIVVGALERAFYQDIVADEDGQQTAGHAAGLAKFDRMVNLGLLEVVYRAPGCLDSTVEQTEDCPAASVYMDTIYHVIPGATYSDEVAAGDPDRTK